jgi:hypothetical protein
MATVSITVTDNGDGTVTMNLPTALSASGAVDTFVKTDSLQAVMGVMKGWIFQSIPLLKIN